jgi:N4-gp56 family major capsid protein
MPTGQTWTTGSLGGTGVGAVPYLTDRLRSIAQPLFRLRQFVDAQEAIGKQRGDTWLFNKTSNVATQGGTLIETNTIPETNYTMSQGTGTVTEYGNSVPYTLKLETLSKFAVDPIVEQKLRDDMVKVIESAVGDQFVATEYKAVCSAGTTLVITTDGTATATATSDLTASNTRAIVNFMKRKLIPKYNGSEYVCVGSVNAISNMFEDTASAGWVAISQYTANFAGQLHSGEVGSYYKVRFVEETGYFSNTLGSGGTHGGAVFFGADNVYEAITIPEEVRVKTSLDYGRDMGIAWYALLGHKIVWDYSVDAEQHIIEVTSA